MSTNEELYLNIEKVCDVMKKPWLYFYAHLIRMDEKKLTSRIFEHSNKRDEINNKLIQMTTRDTSLTNICRVSIWKKDKFRHLVYKIKKILRRTQKKK